VGSILSIEHELVCALIKCMYTSTDTACMRVTVSHVHILGVPVSESEFVADVPSTSLPLIGSVENNEVPSS
jgi:hypothetical protein